MFMTTRMCLEDITLSKTSQTQEDKHRTTPHRWALKSADPQKQRVGWGLLGAGAGGAGLAGHLQSQMNAPWDPEHSTAIATLVCA